MICCPGATPASPRPSPFVNLPDMSPKKVSTMHNIYVSPLLSSKVLALADLYHILVLCRVYGSKFSYKVPKDDNTIVGLILTYLCLNEIIKYNSSNGSR